MHRRGRPTPGAPCASRSPRPALCLAALLVAAFGCSARGPDPGPAAATTARDLYAGHCAACHGARRYGGYSPPLLPDLLARKSNEALIETILDGRPNTQMPAFSQVFDRATAASLVALLREPVGEVIWSADDVAASRVTSEKPGGAIGAHVRREALILVVERGSGQVVVLDGDTMRELDRFDVGRIHGGVKFDLGYRRAVAVTRDGTLADYDLEGGRLRATAKVGVNTRNVAVSRDGRLVAVANQLPQGLVLLDDALEPLRVIELPGQPSAVYQLPGRTQFIGSLRDLPRLFLVDQTSLELSWHDLPEPFEDLTFVPGATQLVASGRNGQRLLLYDYADHEVVAELETVGLPHLFSACFFERDGSLHAAFNHIGTPRLSVVDMRSFAIVRELPLAGAGYFVRTHPATPYLWADTNGSTIQLVDKRTLEVDARRIEPAPGKKAMHVEFTADGDRALVSVWSDEGAVVVYDSASLEERLRIPYAMPVGKYNAANKTRILR